MLTGVHPGLSVIEPLHPPRLRLRLGSQLGQLRLLHQPGRRKYDRLGGLGRLRRRRSGGFIDHRTLPSCLPLRQLDRLLAGGRGRRGSTQVH